MATMSNWMINSWLSFNDELNAFALETEGNEDAVVTLYEDANTTRQVRNFWMSRRGILSWDEEGKKQYENMLNEDDARERLLFWRANLRRARRYWASMHRQAGCHTGETIEDTEE